MKRLSLLFALLLTMLLFPLSPVNASAAAEVYAAVPDKDVWFYAGETESSRVFLLPRSYYVKVLAEGDPYCRVEYLVDEGPYKRITGYCRTEDLLFVDYIPARPYLMKQVTLSYSLPASGTGSIGGGSFSSVERTFVYYGQRYEGAKLYYYVLSEGTFDYIPAEEELVYEENTDYLDYLASRETMGGTAEPPAAGPNAAVIVAICVACAAAVAVAVFLIRGKRTAPPDDQPEE